MSTSYFAGFIATLVYAANLYWIFSLMGASKKRETQALRELERMKNEVGRG